MRPLAVLCAALFFGWPWAGRAYAISVRAVVPSAGSERDIRFMGVGVHAADSHIAKLCSAAWRVGKAIVVVDPAPHKQMPRVFAGANNLVLKQEGGIAPHYSASAQREGISVVETRPVREFEIVRGLVGVDERPIPVADAPNCGRLTRILPSEIYERLWLTIGQFHRVFTGMDIGAQFDFLRDAGVAQGAYGSPRRNGGGNESENRRGSQDCALPGLADDKPQVPVGRVRKTDLLVQILLVETMFLVGFGTAISFFEGLFGREGIKVPWLTAGTAGLDRKSVV